MESRVAVMLRLESALIAQLDSVVKHGAFGGSRAEVLIGMVRQSMPAVLRQVRQAQEDTAAIEAGGKKR